MRQRTGRRIAAMTELLHGLTALDRLAARRGDGLKPALAALLATRRAAAEHDAGAPSAPVVDLSDWRAARQASAARRGLP
jgi:hypothetical protein